jgi:hypothetical protein
MDTREYFGLIDFVEKFLPGGTRKYSSFINKSDNYINLPAKEKLEFIECYFNETIHHFKDVLCSEQRQICALNVIRKFENENNTSNGIVENVEQFIVDSIQEAPTPKIYELNL